MNMTNLYKEDISIIGWAHILNDFGLPADTDEICIKHINHITKSERQEKRNVKNGNDNRTS